MIVRSSPVIACRSRVRQHVQLRGEAVQHVELRNGTCIARWARRVLLGRVRHLLGIWASHALTSGRSGGTGVGLGACTAPGVRASRAVGAANASSASAPGRGGLDERDREILDFEREAWSCDRQGARDPRALRLLRRRATTSC